MSTLQQLTANRLSSKPKLTTVNGRKYLVAPVVMIKEGVLNGSQGPILYNSKEVNNRVDRWNHIPITLGHPEDDQGRKISARNPKVIDKYKIGEVYQSTFVGNKLKALAYFDVELMKQKAPAALSRIRKGQRVELSTGLFTDTIATNGKHGESGKPYKHKLVGYDPDHLALLQNERGACSLEDGCGINTNSDMTANALSHNQIREALNRLIKDEGTEGVYSYVEDVYPKYFIYREGRGTYKQGWTQTSDKVELSGDREEVKATTSYRKVTTTGKSIGFGDVIGNNQSLADIGFHSLLSNDGSGDYLMTGNASPRKRKKRKLHTCACQGKCTKCKEHLQDNSEGDDGKITFQKHLGILDS